MLLVKIILFGVLFVHNMLVFSAIIVAVMSTFLVVRHTRKDEEAGRIEMIRSLPVGKLSNLSATLIVCIIINIIIALVIGIGLALLQNEDMGLISSLLYGATLGATGIVFGSIAALFSQISATSRGAITSSLLFLGIMYLLRAMR